MNIIGRSLLITLQLLSLVVPISLLYASTPTATAFLAHAKIAREMPMATDLSDWKIHNTIIHFCNHIYNNYLLVNLIVTDLLEHGIPPEIVDGELREAISPDELRAYYHIPLSFWQNAGQKRMLQEFLAQFILTQHDAAKLNSDEAFIERYYQSPLRHNDQTASLLIEHLHNTFGVSPWQIPADASRATIYKLETAQAAIRLTNAIDDQISAEFLANRQHFSTDLHPDWITGFALTLEKTVDAIERWVTPLAN